MKEGRRDARKDGRNVMGVKGQNGGGDNREEGRREEGEKGVVMKGQEGGQEGELGRGGVRWVRHGEVKHRCIFTSVF